MRYKDSQSLAADLREFADFVENQGPKLPGDIYVPGLYNSLYDSDKETAKEQAKRVAKVLSKGAIVEKRHDNYSLELIRRFGNIRLIYSISREKFCTRKVVDTKIIPARIVEERVEEIVEWECNDPVLG